MDDKGVVIGSMCLYVRTGLKSCLSEAGFSVIGQTDNGLEICSLIAVKKPAFAIFDIHLQDLNGIAAGSIICRNYRKTRCIILCDPQPDSQIGILYETGVHGVVFRTFGPETLLQALRLIQNGERFFPGDPGHFVRERRGAGPAQLWKKLSPREVEVLKFVLEGMSAPQIAKQLSISSRTVEAHRSNIMRKLDVQNRAQLIRRAIKTGLSDPKEPAAALAGSQRIVASVSRRSGRSPTGSEFFMR